MTISEIGYLLSYQELDKIIDNTLMSVHLIAYDQQQVYLAPRLEMGGKIGSVQRLKKKKKSSKLTNER